ncbi:MAG: aminotransferase class IV [Myxococcota bacterium]
MPPLTSPWFVVDGAVVPASEARIPASDPGALSAEGLFETLLVTRGAVVDVDLHLDRLLASAATLRLVVPERHALAATIDDVVAANAAWLGEDRALRLTVTPGTAWAFLRPIVRARRDGLHLWRIPGARALPQHKTLAWYPVQKLHAKGHDPTFEAVWLDADGAVLEGNTTNLFAVVDGVVRTAPLTRPLLPGIARRRALEALHALAIPVREEAPSWVELTLASEVFASSSLLPLAPVVAIEGARKHQGPVTRALSERSPLGS